MCHVVAGNYVVNREGFLVDPETGEVVDDFSYRVVYTAQYQDDIVIESRRTEKRAEVPRVDVKKYLASLLPEKLREEYLSRVDGITDKAMLFACFTVLCREYGIIFDFDDLRERLGISKISLRRAKKEIMAKGKVRPWERLDRVFFGIAEALPREKWLPAVLLAIEYQRRGVAIGIDTLKAWVDINVETKSHYLAYLLRNEKFSILGVYPYFPYLLCPHGEVARITYRRRKNELRVRHVSNGTECFYVSAKKVLNILSKMELHYEAVRNATQNAVQLPAEHKQSR